MADGIIEDRLFEGMDFRDTPLEAGVHDGCRFVRCVLAGADLSSCTFRACEFRGCDCSLAVVEQAGFQDTAFIGCRLQGVQFARCRRVMLSFSFEECMLRMASFSGLKIRGTRFERSLLEEVDFSGADLRGASFGECDLTRSTFFRTNLEHADFRTARNYAFSPEANRLRGARFSMPEVTGLLEGYGLEIE